MPLFLGSVEGYWFGMLDATCPDTLAPFLLSCQGCWCHVVAEESELQVFSFVGYYSPFCSSGCGVFGGKKTSNVLLLQSHRCCTSTPDPIHARNTSCIPDNTKSLILIVP